MLIPRSALESLESRLESQPVGGFSTASIEIDLDPLDLVRAGSSSFGYAGFFSSPDGTVIGALGVTARHAASGEGRLDSIDRSVSALEPGVPVLVGWSFADWGPIGSDWEGFGSAAAVVPSVTVTRTGGRSRLTLTVPPGSDGRALLALVSTLEPPESLPFFGDVDQSIESRPAPSDYVGLVDEAVAGIKAGPLRKVVLARSVVVRRPTPIDAFDLVARLRDAYPECRVFAWQEGEAVFVGASPELLVAREGDHVRLSPLAGSAPRSPDPERDRLLGDALLSSAKDRFEHEVVVEDALERLRPLVSGLHRSATPQLHRFSTVQHLATTITGTTESRTLQLASALHPTAAVGGSPRSEAMALIEKLEGIDRGWYAGGVGWVDPAGDGEIAIALRCALIRGEQAILYAGNGIVADSDPAAELEETRLKLRPMLDLLT